MKVLVFMGTRPEAIKLAPVIFEMRRRRINFKVCNTGQHREMLEQVLNFFSIDIDYDLNLMRSNQHLNELGSEILKRTDRVLEKELPDLVLVHGDTSTCAFSALATFHREIPIGHIEAGLRTYQLAAPFPEELNRQITARMASIHFAPTVSAKNNLLNENIPEDIIKVTGNTVVDSIHWSKKKIENLDVNVVGEKLTIPSEVFSRFILVTGHRRENFGEGLSQICKAIEKISKVIPVIYPVHLNPNVKSSVEKILGNNKEVYLVPPVEYPILLWLLKNCVFAISDSGGIQEEAPSFRKKVLVTREFSERQEGIESDFSKLVGSDTDRIFKEATNLLKNPFQSNSDNPYGDGHSAEKIVNIILQRFG